MDDQPSWQTQTLQRFIEKTQSELQNLRDEMAEARAVQSERKVWIMRVEAELARLDEKQGLLRDAVNKMSTDIQITARDLKSTADRFENSLTQLQPLVERMAEAKGAWRMLVFVASIAAGIGAMITWATTAVAKLLGHA